MGRRAVGVARPAVRLLGLKVTTALGVSRQRRGSGTGGRAAKLQGLSLRRQFAFLLVRLRSFPSGASLALLAHRGGPRAACRTLSRWATASIQILGRVCFLQPSSRCETWLLRHGSTPALQWRRAARRRRGGLAGRLNPGELRLLESLNLLGAELEDGLDWLGKQEHLVLLRGGSLGGGRVRRTLSAEGRRLCAGVRLRL